MSKFTGIASLIGIFLFSIPAAGDEPSARERIDRFKEATVIVQQLNHYRGTACCIHPDGWFIAATNALVNGKDPDTRLVINPKSDNQRIVVATIARQDETTGLTLLRAEGSDFVSLPLGRDNDLFETNIVNAIGYPVEALHNSTLIGAEIEIHTTRIKSLKKTDGKLTGLGLEQRLPQGEAGGPVVDSQGNIVGILAPVSINREVVAAIAISKIRETLLSPLIEFPVKTIRSTDLAKEALLPVRIELFRESKDLEVTLEFESGGEPVTLAADPNTEHQYIARMKWPAKDVMPKLQLEVHYGNNLVLANWGEPTITIGEDVIPICEIRRFEFSTESKDATVMTNTRTVTGKVPAFQMARLELSGVVAQFDLLQADKVFGSLLPAEKTEIGYRVVLHEEGTLIGELSGKLKVETVEAIPVERDPRPRIDFPPPVLTAPLTIVKLPVPIDDVVAGAGGRFLLLHLKKLKQIAVFDVSQAKVVKYLPMVSSNITYAAGAGKLFIGRQDDRRIQRWDLQTLEPELTVDAPVGGLRKLAMGAKSYEPLFLLSDTDAKKSWLIDPVSLKAEPLQFEGWRRGAWGPVHINVSHDGGSVVVCGGGWAGLELSTIADGQIQSQKMGGYSIDEALIAGNGALVFPTKGPALREDLTKAATEFEGSLFPALDDFLSLSYAIHDGKAVLNIFSNTDARRICTLRDLPELNEKSALPIHNRVFLIPVANVLITVGPGNDHLILRPFDLEQLLKADDVDYLFVRSEPHRTVTRGDEYSYPMMVMSRKGGVTYELQSGPEGMTISPDGVLTWKAPVDIKAGNETIIVKVRDKSQQETFHTFRLRLR